MRNIPGAVRLLLTATVLAASSAHGQTIDRARQLLTEAYNWFTEGFDLPDQQEARQLLAVLG